MAGNSDGTKRLWMMIMLPINTAAVAAAAGESAVNGASDVNGATEQTCYTPVTDPDSIALLAAMHEANRFFESLRYSQCCSDMGKLCLTCMCVVY